ncbi:MAG: [acyl-carrier-protein] S-malonyltransferase [Chloroflexi bacterium RBG_13_53_26]|nr:MAG: [acyl-carrier-protein] S-malonyltransferase [Chloroflexi bacterium RBG_13_53_26]
MNKRELTAYVFPGQGSQWVGMAHDIYESSIQAREVFEEADSSLGFALSRLCFEGSQDVLRQTINAQPAILTVSTAYLRAGVQLNDKATLPSFVAGHSLGEYTALVAAQVLTFKDALYLARERGRLMQEAGERNPGGMLAIIGLDEMAVRAVCDTTGIQIANINCPGQIVVSGPAHLLTQATELAKAKGAQRVIPLQVSGAFHSHLMEPAVEGMSHAISTLTFRDATIPIIANTTALPLTSAPALRAELLSQLLNCVQWQKSIEHMIKEGVTTFVEIGPGQVLTGLIKRISSKEVKAISIENDNHRSDNS